MRRRGLLVLLASPVLLAQAAAPVFPPGSAIGLVPPPGMRLAMGFSGFQDDAAAASILVASLPAKAYAEVSTADDAKFEQAQGVRVERRRALQAGGAPAVLLSGTQTVRGVVNRKWVLIAGAPALTALVTVQVPTDAAAKIGQCTLRVDGHTYLDGPCNIDLGTGGSFSIGTGNARTGSRYFAYVNRDPDSGIADGYWNGAPGSTHAHDPLGTLRREGACWMNERARVCARAAQ